MRQAWDLERFGPSYPLSRGQRPAEPSMLGPPGAGNGLGLSRLLRLMPRSLLAAIGDESEAAMRPTPTAVDPSSAAPRLARASPGVALHADGTRTLPFRVSKLVSSRRAGPKDGLTRPRTRLADRRPPRLIAAETRRQRRRSRLPNGTVNCDPLVLDAPQQASQVSRS